MNDDHDAVDQYLDDLLLEMHGSPRAVRRALVEVEDHLREAAAEASAGGAGEEDSQRAAIERFGPPRLVARRLAQAERRSLVARWALGALRLAGIALTAVGLSGLIVAAMALLLGPSFVLGFKPSQISVGPAPYCSELLSQYPSAGSCGLAFQQATLVNELLFRLVPGAVGLLILSGLWLASRRWPDGRFRLLTTWPAAVLLGGAIIVAAALATGREPGVGVHLAGTLSAGVVVVICAASLLRRRPHAQLM